MSIYRLFLAASDLGLAAVKSSAEGRGAGGVGGFIALMITQAHWLFLS